MKIIHIVLGKANPNRMNGVNKVAHNLATVQKDMGYDVVIFGLSNTEEKDKIERNYDIEFYKRKKFYIDSPLKQSILVQDKKETIFHIHGGFIMDFYFISRFLKKLNFRYIFTSHGSYNREAMKKNYFVKKIFFILFDKNILKNAWKAQFLGNSEYKYIDTMIKDINKVLVPNGQNIEELKFYFTKINLYKRPIFGFVGRVDSYTKGLDILFDGFFKYKKNGGKGILWIIGNGVDLKKLKEFVTKKKLEKDIIFLGSKFGEEKLNLIANMDIFVHTSRFEGFPMSVLEAAGLKTALLVSTETNFGGYVEKYNSGLVLIENNSYEVEKNLFKFENLFFSEKLQRISNNAYRMIKDNFGWKEISKQLLKK